MEVLSLCFKDLIFTKVDSIDGYAVYAALVQSNLGANKKRYIIVHVRDSFGTPDKSKFDDLNWLSVQTRILQNSYRLPRQHWRVGRDVPNVNFDIVQRTQKATEYSSSFFPVKLSLLHDPKKKSIYQFYARTGLIEALETFSCVIEKIDQRQNFRDSCQSCQEVYIE